MNEVLDEYKAKPKSSLSLRVITFFLLAIILVVIFGIYVGNVLFGERSYVVLKELQKQKAYLYKDNKKLQKENAQLQKIYLETIFLDPDFKEQTK